MPRMHAQLEMETPLCLKWRPLSAPLAEDSACYTLNRQVISVQPMPRRPYGNTQNEAAATGSKWRPRGLVDRGAALRGPMSPSPPVSPTHYNATGSFPPFIKASFQDLTSPTHMTSRNSVTVVITSLGAVDGIAVTIGSSIDARGQDGGHVAEGTSNTS